MSAPLSATATAPAATAPLADAEGLAKRMDNLCDLLREAKGAGDGSGRQSLPHVRKGEDPLSSRGYSFLKLFQAMARQIDPANAKVEIDLHNRFKQLYAQNGGYTHAEPNTILAPVSSEFMPQEHKSDRDFADEVRGLVKAGVSGYDPMEVARMKAGIGARKALSWQDEAALGALIPPPMMGELIDILRNNEVLMAAGARSVGMPPNGRMVWPRATGAGTAYYVGESVAITETEPTTGDVTLQARKVATLVKIPKEFFRYSSISIEAFVRDDMMKVMALRMDKELLEGVGSAVAPKGLINYAGITSHTSTGTPASGDAGYPLQPEDLLQMVAKVEEKNAQFKTWVGRPLLWAYIANKRADAITAADGKGQFLFNVLRGMEDGRNVDRMTAGVLQGYPFVKSTQVSNARVRGSGSTFSYLLGGDFSDYMIAISPTVEFAMATQGDTAFAADQTWLRAILPHDGAPRREASFVLCDQLLLA